VKLLAALQSVLQECSFCGIRGSHSGEDVHGALLVKIQTFFFFPFDECIIVYYLQNTCTVTAIFL
jgi:di/tripeptidase